MEHLKIREARKTAKMTQDELAKLLGINRATLSRYESGTIDPPSSQLQRIAAALNIPVTDLLDKGGCELYGIGAQEGFEAEEWFNRQVDEAWASMGYTHSEQECYLIEAFSQLTDAGQQKVTSYAQDLTQIDEYRRQTAPQAPSPPPEGTDTTSPENVPETPPEGD